MTTRKLKVIIADDEEHVRKLLRSIMEHLNLDIVGEATNGLEAEKLYQELIPDLMLLDINMPQKTGIEVLESIISKFPDAFIVILTAVSDIQSVKRCIQSGAANFIRKDTPIPTMAKILDENINIFKKKKKQNSKKYNLNLMLKEIEEDEKVFP